MLRMQGEPVADISLLKPGWQAFIATTSFGAGYTILICASLTTNYEFQDWCVAITAPKRAFVDIRTGM